MCVEFLFYHSFACILQPGYDTIFRNKYTNNDRYMESNQTVPINVSNGSKPIGIGSLDEQKILMI